MTRHLANGTSDVAGTPLGDAYGSYVNESTAALQQISINLYVLGVMKKLLTTFQVYSSWSKKYNQIGW